MNDLKKLVGKIAIIAFVLGIFLAILLYVIYPYHPKNFIGWIILFFIGGPAYILWEIIGDIISGNDGLNKNSHRKSSIIRRSILIVICIIFFIIFTSLGHGFREYFVKY